jgi:pimeloyl-ACP methyl ester carboxylesterase
VAAAISKHALTHSLGCLSAGPADAPETLVFLHGWGGSKELWWRALTDLAATHRVFALDLPGTGGTPLPPRIRTMADFSHWVRDVCRRLDLPSVTLVGHSLGGNLAARVALDAPALARRLVLVDAALEPHYLPVRSWWPLSPRHGLTALRLLRWSSLPLAALGRRVPHAHAGGELRSFARRAAYYVRTNTDPALQTQLAALMGSHLAPERLAALRMPLLIVHGAHDAMVPVARARALAAAMPQARLMIFPRALHVPMDTDPPAFSRALREFCEG